VNKFFPKMQRFIFPDSYKAFNWGNILASLKLDSIFNPKSIALIGASDEEGSVGFILMKNLTETGYKGIVYPVNIHKPDILGKKAYTSVTQLPQVVDLAIIATPAATVPDR